VALQQAQGPGGEIGQAAGVEIALIDAVDNAMIVRIN
jgi:hypothetical protein